MKVLRLLLPSSLVLSLLGRYAGAQQIRYVYDDAQENGERTEMGDSGWYLRFDGHTERGLQ